MRAPRGRALVAAGGLALASLASSGSAGAGPMDPALSRLVVDPACRVPGASSACVPDRASYRKLVSEWGFVLAPASPHPARTSGLDGVDVAIAAAFTGVSSEAEHWRRGTRGQGSDDADGLARENADPSGLLALYTLELRKGFGFGIEAAVDVGVTPSSSLLAWGGQVRIVPLEGLEGGPYGYLPDFSVGAGLRKVAGMRDLELSIHSLDARVSRGFVVEGRQIVTPWLGYQWVSIAAEPALSDLTPETAPLPGCGYRGVNQPGTDRGSASPASGAPEGVFDGSALCTEPSGGDFDNLASFGDVSVARHRVLVGVAYRRERLSLAAQVVTDLLSPGDAQGSATSRRELECDSGGAVCEGSPRQWTLSVAVGARF